MAPTNAQLANRLRLLARKLDVDQELEHRADDVRLAAERLEALPYGEEKGVIPDKYPRLVFLDKTPGTFWALFALHLIPAVMVAIGGIGAVVQAVRRRGANGEEVGREFQEE